MQKIFSYLNSNIGNQILTDTKKNLFILKRLHTRNYMLEKNESQKFYEYLILLRSTN